jgi:biopolymer transport protein ExbB/TolQ
MTYKKWLYGGLSVFLVSTLVGLLRTIWNIYGSFDALETAESAGIKDVGTGIENALCSTIFGLLGSMVGIVLILIGVFKAYRR